MAASGGVRGDHEQGEQAMSPFQRVLCVLIAVGFVLAALLSRYEIVSASSGAGTVAYELDRWTGAVTAHR
jgi:hypothetical protein